MVATNGCVRVESMVIRFAWHDESYALCTEAYLNLQSTMTVNVAPRRYEQIGADSREWNAAAKSVCIEDADLVMYIRELNHIGLDENRFKQETYARAICILQTVKDRKVVDGEMAIFRFFDNTRGRWTEDWD